MTIHGYYFSFTQFYLPSPITYTIYFSGPLFVILIDYFVYNTKITKKQSIGVIIAFFGVLLTTNGAIIMSFITGNYSEFDSKF